MKPPRPGRLTGSAGVAPFHAVRDASGLYPCLYFHISPIPWGSLTMYVLIKDLRRSRAHVCANKGLTRLSPPFSLKRWSSHAVFSITYSSGSIQHRFNSYIMRAFHFGNSRSAGGHPSQIPGHQSQRMSRRTLNRGVAELRGDRSTCKPFRKLIPIIIAGHLTGFAGRDFHQRLIPVRSVRHRAHARAVCRSHRFDATRRAGLKRWDRHTARACEIGRAHV